MPKFNKQTDDEIIKNEQKTNSGITLSAGEISHSDWDSKDWRDLQKDYTEMINGCPIISTTWQLIEFPLMSANIDIKPGKSQSDKSKEAVDYLYWFFDNLYKGEPYLRRHKLSSIYKGLQLHEVIIKKGDKYEYIQNNMKSSKLTNRIIKLSPIQNDTINKFYYDEQNNFIGFEHDKRSTDGNKQNYYLGSKQDFIDVDVKDIHWMTYNETDDDIRGNSILRPVRFYYEAGNKILQSKVIGVQRGVGLTGIHTIGNVSDAEKSRLEKLGRTIANMKQGYYLIDETRAKVVFNSLQSQENVMELLQFIMRMKFYNTMSQFMTAGINESGSRAATSEHKSPYELALNHHAAELTRNYQDLCDKVIDISYLSPMAAEDYPVITFTNITQADMLREATVIKTLSDAGMILTETDMNMIREHINLPVNKTEIETKQTIVDENMKENEDIKDKKVEMSYKHGRKVKPEILEFESNIFEFESANEHYLTVQDLTEAEINIVMEKLFSDISRQLKRNRKGDIDMRYEKELVSRLTKLYEKAFNRGESDAIKEFNKLSGKNIELSLTGREKKDIKSNIDKLVKKFFVNIKTVVETKYGRVTDKYIKNKGGIEKYLLEFQTGFKKDKRGLISEIADGYQAGRGDILEAEANNIELYLYSASLDTNLCDHCAPLDGGIYTEDELKDMGLNFQPSINPDCLGLLGGNVCRCQVIPYKLKG